MKKLGDYEVGIYALAATGIVGDHISTRLALTQPQIKELNPLTVALFQNNMWFFFDILMLILALGVPYFLMRKWNFRGRWAILAYPLLFGIGRLAAAVHNIMLLASIFF